MALKNLLIAAMVCPIFGVPMTGSTALAAPDGERLVASQAAPIAELVKQLTTPELSWETRLEAEERLKTLDSQAVMLALMPVFVRGMPIHTGGIWNGSGSAVGDKIAPPQWQIFYAVRRVWNHHEMKLWRADATRLAPINRQLLTYLPAEFTDQGTIIGQLRVSPQAAWLDEAEMALVELMRNKQTDESLRLQVIRVLLVKTKAKYYDEIKAIVTSYPQNTEEQIGFKAIALQALMENLLPQKNQKTDQGNTDRDLLNIGFVLLAQMERLRKGNGYFLALRLGTYVGQEFKADQKDPKYQDAGRLSPAFFEAAATNALAWWKTNKIK